MITPSNFLRLPYTPDLTEGGIAYALRSLTYSPDHAANYQRLRQLAAGAAVEIAFRRYLSAQDVPFEVQPAPTFGSFERYDVSLDGRRCDIQSYLISHREQLLELRRRPELLLNAQALVPSDQHARDGHKRNDLYIFAFLAGLSAASQEDLKKAIASDQPHYLAYLPPLEWRNPLHWNPLGALTLKSESTEEVILEIHGQDSGRAWMRKTVSLPPQTKITIHEGFYSVSSFHIRSVPQARIGVHSEALEETCVIAPLEWGNIWVYGMDIFLTGWLSHEEFSQAAKPLPINSRTFQYEHTRVKNLYVPVSQLKPLDSLFK